MKNNDCSSFEETFSAKLKKCKSKKDYKKLCKEMVFQFGVIDKVDTNQWKIFSHLIGEDNYCRGVSLAIKMYILESQGIECDIISYEDIFNDDYQAFLPVPNGQYPL